MRNLLLVAAVVSTSAFHSGNGNGAGRVVPSQRSLYTDDVVSSTRYLSAPKIKSPQASVLFPQGRGLVERMRSEFATQCKRGVRDVRAKKARWGLVGLAGCFFGVSSARKELSKTFSTQKPTGEDEKQVTIASVEELISLVERAALFKQTLEASRRAAAGSFLRSRMAPLNSAAAQVPEGAKAKKEEEALWEPLWAAGVPLGG